MKNKISYNYLGALVLLLIILIISLMVAVTIGSVNISISEVYKVITYKILKVGVDSGAVTDVVWLIRLPRLVLAVAIGMGLSICGVVMQAIVKNPLADPYILGISSGASLGATVAILLGVGIFFGSNYVGVCAFIGAFIVSILVMVLANIRGHADSTKLLLSGMALSSLCSSFSSFIVYFANDKEGIQNITYWLMGSLSGANWPTIQFILPLIIAVALFFWTQYRTLNMMLFGDEVAITLGADLHRCRLIYLLIISSVIGFVVYASGMIGFVGLIIPHLVRMLFGTDHKKLIPLSALTGAIFLIWADVLSRIIIPKTELPIGILISMIGAPCFIYLMIKKTYAFGGVS